MLKHSDMTEEARLVFEVVPHTMEVTVNEVAECTYLTEERCQLILTQLAMAGLIKENIKGNTFQNI
ncbi:TrmB family transcriptional regulator [Proteus faecis]|uniref:TrmB family transcriptional regulator n=1 Tax=Proteus faecis TaxID=2050967 RepID=A0AAW7CHK3_9GAMM|nr:MULTISPECIES: TrmB family transcriptional regulator [Proteus]HEK0336948.1 TrmB family transcriptional regulator [Proteus mirabilis]MDL5165871.1 TrmB family transcriptional regulator [Proteus faecis]MDL5273865.1 TrmB family transcriptional regulator [Proteus faecis]MDL5277435.1 TrmB family transcriptional regulator [Proteus faecis]MDL5306425.1 TrmB family transcriptional regulator [Proteus faecis]